MNRKSLLVLLLGLLLVACGLEVPGGGDDFSTPTPDLSRPTFTPVIITPAVVNTPTSVPPPPTPVPPTAISLATSAPTSSAAPTTQPAPATQQPTVAGTPAATATRAPTSGVAAPGPVGEMVAIPAGAFTMGSNDAKEDQRPSRKVDLPAYQIDKYPVTNALFDLFVKTTGYRTASETKGESQSWRTYFSAGKEQHPVVKVNWADAQAFCQWAGKRLPTEAEWEKAARGVEGRIYPWGNDYDPAKFNGRASGIRGTTAVGSYPAGASPFGVFDMAGNVWQWTADWYQPYPGNTASSPYYGEKFKVTRGGGWFDEKDQVRSPNRNAADPGETKNDDLGFRCAK